MMASTCFRIPFSLDANKNNETITQFMCGNNLVSMIQFDDCPTINDATIMISNLSHDAILDKFVNLIAIIVKINNTFNLEKIAMPSTPALKKRKLLIIYESTIDNSQKIIFWRNKNFTNFNIIKLVEYSAIFTDFVRNFLVENVNSNLSDLAHNLELISLIDSNGLNLLMKAVKNDENLTLINELLKLPFDINQISNDNCLAIDMAWQNKNSQIILRLLQANSTFPHDFNEREVTSSDVNNFLQTSKNMHEALLTNNVTSVEKILKENSNLRYFYNEYSISAATLAIKNEKFVIYGILTKHNCSIGPTENYDDIMKGVSVENKLQIRDIHSISAISFPEKHLAIHYSNIVVAHDDQAVKERVKYIKKAYVVLNEIPLIKQILDLTAANKTFKIHFDFNRDSVEFMDPKGASSGTKGLFYPNNYHIYVAAKELLRNENKSAAIGTLAHELCHFAINLTFCNNAKPYHIEDERNKKIFDEVILKCKQQKDNEIIVNGVFGCYEESKWPAELIVRVPHMLAHYYDNQIKLNQLKVTFKELFDYYNEFVVPNIAQTLTIMEFFLNKSMELNYYELTEAYKAKIHHSDVNFQGQIVKLRDMIGFYDSEIISSLTAEQIREILFSDTYFEIGTSQRLNTQFFMERLFIHNENKQFSNYPSNFKTFDQLLQENLRSEKILLADHAGTGKSTTFKHMAIELKKFFPNFWISYVDLKRHLKIFEKFEKHKGEMTDDLLTQILIEILSIDELEVKIFKELFHFGKVILLFDGVDEIAPDFKDFFIKFTQHLIYYIERRNTNRWIKNKERIACKIWIATRPQHVSELISKLNIYHCYRLVPYDDNMKTEFIKKVIRSFDVTDVNEQKMADEIISTPSLKCDKIDNPLLLQIITELYVKHEKAITVSNKYALYEKILQMKKKVLCQRGEIANQDRDNEKSTLSIWQIHQIYALKLLYREKFNYKFTRNPISINELCILKKWKNQQSKWTPEAISRYGFLIVDNWNKPNEFPDFIHRTFAEFFVAQFINDNIFDTCYDCKSEEEIESILSLFIFILEKIMRKQSRSRLMDPTITEWDFLPFLLESNKVFNESISNFIKCDRFQKYLLDNFTVPYKTILHKIFAINENFIKHYQNEKGETIFHDYLINAQYFTQILELIEIYQKLLGSEWLNYLGFSMKADFSMPSETILSCDFIQRFNDKNEIQDSTKSKCKKFYNFLYIFEQTEIPLNIFCNFLGNYLFHMIDFACCSMATTKKFLQILQSKYHENKDEIDLSLKSYDSVRQCCNTEEAETDEILSNVNYFCINLKKILCLNRKLPDYWNQLVVEIFAFFCNAKKLKELFHKYGYCTQTQIQNHFIRYSIDFVPIFDDDLVEDFENLIEEIFLRDENEEHGKDQLRKFLRKNDLHNGESVFARISLEAINSKTPKNIMISLKSLARKADLSDDEVENLSEFRYW